MDAHATEIEIETVIKKLPGGAIQRPAGGQRQLPELGRFLRGSTARRIAADSGRTDRKSLLALRGVGPDSDAGSVRSHGHRLTKLRPEVNCRRRAEGR